MTLVSDVPFVGLGRNSKLGGRVRGNNASINEQRDSVAHIARSNELPYDGEFYEEEDTSGATFDRKVWRKVVDLVLSGERAGVIALDLDRTSRAKTAEVLLMIEEIEDAGGQVYDMTGRVTVSTDEGEMLTTMRAMGNRMEWRKRQRYNRKAIATTITNGVHMNVPYGYMRETPATPLVKHPTEHKVVVRVFKLRKRGWTFERIADALNDDGVACRPQKLNGKVRDVVWTGNAIRRMVRNCVYLGIAYHGQHKHIGAHVALVTRELFDDAQDTKGTTRNDERNTYMLSGLVRCSSCGYVMRRGKAGGKGKPYYSCQSPKARCAHRVSVPAEQLEAECAAAFKTQAFGRVDTVAAVEASVDVDTVRAVLADAEDNLERVLMMRVAAASKSEQKVQARIEEKARVAVREAEANVRDAEMSARGFKLPADLDADGFDAADVDRQRHYISTIWAAVVVRPARVWREAVADRAQVVRVDETPKGVRTEQLIDYCASLAWDSDEVEVGVIAA